MVCLKSRAQRGITMSIRIHNASSEPSHWTRFELKPLGLGRVPSLRSGFQKKSIQPHKINARVGVGFTHHFLRTLLVVFSHSDAQPVAAHGTGELKHSGCAITSYKLFLQP